LKNPIISHLALRGSIMRNRFLKSAATGAIAAAVVGAVVAFLGAQTSAQGPTASTLKTNWGEPDLQGIWTDEFDTPLQRSAKYANQEFFTEAQRQELDNERSALIGRRVTEQGLAGACNFAVFLTTKRTGARTSLIVDPVDGRIPPRTPQAQKAAAADREFHLALLQSTETCKKKALDCTGGRYDPTPSPRRVEPPPRYNNVRINRYDGPEDGSLADRCLTRGLPDFVNPFGGSFRRIVQTPGGVSIYYDVGQGQGWQRNIVMDASPHLPASIRQWYGDSRGHWEGDTLVIDVTNFSPKADFLGARESLHLVERWTRSSPSTLEYEATIEDPTVWTRSWKQQFTKQSDRENRIYYEPRCIEGNYGLLGLLHGQRMEEFAFAEGRGPDPATKDVLAPLVDTAEDAFHLQDPLFQ
jgi:hypothetical protein